MLTVSLCGNKMRNPLILASGIRGNSAELLIRAAKEGAGAATSKSCSLLPRKGHANPTMIGGGIGGASAGGLREGGAAVRAAYINAIGLSNPGVEEEAGEIRRAVKEAGIPIIASIVAFSADDFGKVAARISEARPHMIEVDASCPNIENGGKMFSNYIADAVAVTESVRANTSIPFSIKISPDVPNIGEIAAACVGAGADCITAINTMGGMCIDAYARRAVLHNRFGGISGPALKPIALKSVYNIRKAIGPGTPIIGTGGVASGIDAAEMLLAGATAVGIGTAVALRKNAFREITGELQAFMKEAGHKRISDLSLLEK